MRIHRISLRDYRGVVSSDVSFPATGTTIIEGDNEVGKSSLAEAIDLVLDVRDDSKKARVKAVAPVDRDAGPEVTIDLTTGPYRFTLTKRWLRRPETTLTITEPQRSQLTGREAHDRVTEILDETLDRELWRALRLEQGTDLAQASFEDTSLGRALDGAAGGELAGEGEDGLWARIVAERDRYWTATGRASAERVRLQTRVTEAVEQVRTIEAELREMDAQTDEMARLEDAAVDLAATQVGLEAAVVDLAGQAEAVTELKRAVTQLEADHKAAVAAHERWVTIGQTRDGLIAAVQAASARLTAAEAEAVHAEPGRAAAAARQESAAEARSLAAEQVRVAEDAARRAVADAEHHRQKIEIEQFSERLERVVAQQAALEAAEAVLESSPVDAVAVSEIEDATLEVARAEAGAAAGAAAVRVSALADTTVEVDGEPLALAAGDTAELSVASRSELVVPGLVSFAVEAGSHAQALDARLEEARQALGRLCRHHGVADLSQARRIAAERLEAERVRGDATARIRDDLRDLTVEGLARKIERHTARIAAYENERPAEPSLPTDLDQAQALARHTDQLLTTRRQDLADAEAALAEAVTAVQHGEVSNAGLVERVKLDRESLALAEASLAAARATDPDADIAAALAAAAQARQQATERLAQGQLALDRADPDTIDLLLTNSREAQARGAKAIRDNHDRRTSLGSILADRGEQGLAQRRDAAVTQRDRLAMEHERLESRAEAALYLHDTFAQRRSEARARYVAPFRDTIEKLGRLVFGPTLEVELDADLRIARRTLDGVTCDFEQLSTGAREQLGLLSRLACASIVAGSDGVPVIFDDALGWTDPKRLGQMAAAIGVASRDCQVIVLTCTPGRFANVGNATVVRLPGDCAPVEHHVGS